MDYQKLYDMARRAGLNHIVCVTFANYIIGRGFENSGAGYLSTWLNRFENGNAWDYSDTTGRKLLSDLCDGLADKF
jgi:hypothetical protein